MVRPASNNTNVRQPQAAAPSPVSNIAKIASLKKYPDKDYANSLLHKVAKLVAPIIHENNFKVGNLCEMYPKNPNLLGLNVNRGQKILIRLRHHSNDRSFYPLEDIIGTFLHELTHNLYGAHDEKFYKFLDGLNKRYDEIQYGGVISKSGYRCEEEKLGGGGVLNRVGGYVSVRDQRIKELSKHKFKAESRKLGTEGGRITKPKDPRVLREAMLRAAERRAKDGKWCHSNTDEVEAVPSQDELDIEEISPPKPATAISHSCSSAEKYKEYKDIIDLTNEETGQKFQPDNEIIVIDGCEEEAKHPKSCLRQDTSYSSDSGTSTPRDSRRVQFSGLLPSFDDESTTGGMNVKDAPDEEMIQYTASTSPRAFFGDANAYPRRKLVADLNFDQIIKKSKRITVHLDHTSAKQKTAKTTKSVGEKSKVVHQKPKPKTTNLKKDKSETKKAPKVAVKNHPKPKKSQDSKQDQSSKNQTSRPVKKTVKAISFADLL